MLLGCGPNNIPFKNFWAVWAEGHCRSWAGSFQQGLKTRQTGMDTYQNHACTITLDLRKEKYREKFGSITAAPLVWLDIVKNEILQESQKTNSAIYGPILPCLSPVSHSFMLNGPNSSFKFMMGQPNSLQSLKKGQKLTEYNHFMDRRMHTHTICLFVWW